MGPKKGKKGAATPTQGEEAKAGEKISEVDKEWFGIQIKSLEEKLDRRNQKLRFCIQPIVLFDPIKMRQTFCISFFSGDLRSETRSLKVSTFSSGKTKLTLLLF